MQAAPQRRLAVSPAYVSLQLYIPVCAILAVFAKTALHQIPEGHVGVYWRGGRLLHRVTDPGFRSKVPFLDTYEAIQVTVQTDQVRDIPCGTKGGVNVTFEKIEVVNRLKREHVHRTIKDYGVHYDRIWIYDKIHHEINQFCSSRSLQEIYIDKFDQVDDHLMQALQSDCDRFGVGIEIISVRLTKPRIPSSIMDNYVAMEVQRTHALVALERQRVVQHEAETERYRAVAEAKRNAEISVVRMDQATSEKEAELRQQQLANEIMLTRRRARADADLYAARAEAEGNALRLTPSFLELQYIRALGNNTKLFFGDRLPTLLLDSRLPASALQHVAAAAAAQQPPAQPAAASSAAASNIADRDEDEV